MAISENENSEERDQARIFSFAAYLTFKFKLHAHDPQRGVVEIGAVCDKPDACGRETRLGNFLSPLTGLAYQHRNSGPWAPKFHEKPGIGEDLARAAALRNHPSAPADRAVYPNQRREWKQRATPSLIAADRAGGCGRVARACLW